MRFSTLIECPILLLGGGREGEATRNALKAWGNRAPVWVTGDQEIHLPSTEWIAPSTLAALPRNTLVIRSPGFAPHHPIRQSIDQLGFKSTTATRIALTELREAKIPVIGITGSKGKSTTSVLTHAILQASGVHTILVGNIGIPVLQELPNILEKHPTVVMELSSYHCDDLGDIPITTAVLGRLFPEHLTWHGKLRDYYGAKLKLLKEAEHRIIDARNEATLEAQGLLDTLPKVLEWVNSSQGLHFEAGQFMEGVTPLTHDTSMKIPGLHNRENACLAFAAARTLGGTLEGFQYALKTTAPLPFRLESEGIYAGIEWINDSISTAPEASAAALDAFGPRGVHTLIVGGQDRGYDYAPLVEAIDRNQTMVVIGLPETGHLLKLNDTPLHCVNTLEEAVDLAIRLTPAGGRCVFSPGAPSYHLWSGFEERGLDLRKFIKAAHR